MNGERHWNPYFKYLLGILDHDEIFWLPSDATHTIQLHGIEQNPTTALAGSYADALIPKSPTSSYWVFYRDNTTLCGIDEGPPLISTEDGGGGPTTQLYDMRPQTSGVGAGNDWNLGAQTTNGSDSACPRSRAARAGSRPALRAATACGDLRRR